MEELTSKDKILLDKVYLSIGKNISNEKYSVEQLATDVCLSRSMLHRKLIQLLGKSANDLIIEARLEYAKKLLKDNFKTVSEVAYEVGFKTSSYFNKVFKDRFNISPGAFQNNKEQIYVKSNKHTFRVLLSVVLLAILISTAYVFINTGACRRSKSVAILPFINLSSDVENQFLADGIMEDLLSRLSKVEGLKVISSTSSSRFRDRKNITIQEISKQLQVRYIIEGSVRRDAKKMRLNVQLIDARNDKHIWAKLYDRKVDKMFEIQSELSREISKELCFVLTDKEKEKLTLNQTINSEALKNKQIGRYYLNKRTREDMLKSVPYFKQAIEKDPEYALAYAELADAYFLLAWYDVMDRHDGMDSARYWANKALEIDNDLAEAHNILAYVLWDYDWDMKAGEREFLTSIKLNPNHSLTHQYYAEFLGAIGRRKEARYHINKAIELDPLCFVHRIVSSKLYLLDKDYDNALAEVEFGKDFSDNHIWSYNAKFKIFAFRGDEQNALKSFKNLGLYTGQWRPKEADEAFRKEKIIGLLKLGIKFQKKASDKTVYYLMLNEYDKAMEQIELQINQRMFHPYSLMSVAFEKLNTHPRYVEILDSIGIKHK